METLKMNWKKILAISAICAVIDAVIHVLWAPAYEYSVPSFFIKNNLFRFVAPVGLFIIYAQMGIVFAYIQERLPGKKIGKGLRYAISFGGLWFLGVIGMSLIFNSPIKIELVTGGLDFLTVILLGLLLGKFVTSDNMNIAAGEERESIRTIFTIGLIYFIGRYLAYAIFNVELAYSTKLPDTLLWTFGIGFWMGLTYLLLKQSLDGHSPVKKAVLFGGLILGIFWVLYNFFALLLVKVSATELIILVGSDILLVAIGIWVLEAFVKKIRIE